MKKIVDLTSYLSMSLLACVLCAVFTSSSARAETDLGLPLQAGPTVEIGAGAVFVSAHPQVRLGWLFPYALHNWGHLESQLLYLSLIHI